jgi:hypothetical protein
MRSDRRARRAPGNRLRWPVIAIGAAGALALGLVWLVAVPIGPEACALSMPGPRNCFDSERVQAAILPTVAIVATSVLSLVLVFVWPGKSRLIAVSSVIVLLALAVMSYLLVAWIPALAWWWRPVIAP